METNVNDSPYTPIKTDTNCPFCDIRDNNPDSRIIEYSQNTFSFHDRNKGRCKVHIMTCPRKHIINYKHLKKEDIPILQEMKAEAHRIGVKYGQGNKFRIGFHKPPFYSIKHLHLHICIEPITGCFNQYIKYGWIMKDIDSVIHGLEKLQK
jgi:sulfate adenylyltransferase (ADP) / adenylylsulfatase